MRELRFTLLSDGSSDRALIPILKWLLIEHGVAMGIRGDWAEPRFLRSRRDMAARVRTAVKLYSSDLLFIHRDAEGQDPEQRRGEIQRATEAAFADSPDTCPAVCVVPVRMTEAWLLFDPAAIRLASGNPSGAQQLDLPAPNRIEGHPNPKHLLHDLLQKASGLTGRRLKKFSVHQAKYRLATSVTDFSPLRQLPAFRSLDEEVRETVVENGWTNPENQRLNRTS